MGTQSRRKRLARELQRYKESAGVSTRARSVTTGGGDTPSFAERKPGELVELPPPERLHPGLAVNPVNSYVRFYRLGGCSVIVTKEYGLWHLSVARPDRLPGWDEVAEARYRVVPGSVTMAMLLPPRDQYININPNVLQMVEVKADAAHARYVYERPPVPRWVGGRPDAVGLWVVLLSNGEHAAADCVAIDPGPDGYTLWGSLDGRGSAVEHPAGDFVRFAVRSFGPVPPPSAETAANPE